jgi:tetratricopeptide (TPR) repeat protein
LKKELKQQIKRDEFVSVVEHAASWAAAHPGELRIGIGVAAVVAVAAGALVYVQGNRAREAESAFREAVTIYQAPIAAEIQPEADKPAGPVFPTAEEKYKTAAAAFDGVERRFGTLAVAERARYYAALCRVELRQYPEAEKALRGIASRKDDKRLEPALARLALADLLRRQGQVDKAVEEYRAIAGDGALTLPRDFALMSLAGTLEDAKRPAEAGAAYKRLTEEFPTSVYAAEARRRAGFLQSANEG